MKTIAAALVIATLAGCAIVPIGPPIVVGVHARGDYGYGGGGYYRDGRGYYGGRGGWYGR